MRWKPAPCGVSLSEQLDEIYGAERPNDGTVGDLAHSARLSDHNPQPPDGWVDARDVYDWRDLDANALMHRLARSRDRRILYVISHGQMCSSYAAAGYPAWAWRPYRGLNGHFSHGHISFRDEYRHDRSPWAVDDSPLPSAPAPAPAPSAQEEDDDMALKVLKRVEDGQMFLYGPGVWTPAGSVEESRELIAVLRDKKELNTPTLPCNAREADLIRYAFTGEGA